MSSNAVSAADWMKGIGLSILASIIGGASKLAIRKSWLMEEEWSAASVDVADAAAAVDVAGAAAAAAATMARQDSSSSRSCSAAIQDPENNDDDDDDDAYVQYTRGSMDANDMDANDENSSNNSVNSTLPNGRPQESSTDADADADENFSDESVRNNNNNDHIQSSSSSSSLSPISAKKKRTWLARTLRGGGMIGMSVLNPACCVLAMNYASPSILAPFSGLTLVWIILFSQPLINEKPSTLQVAAAALIVLGETIIAIFGDHTNNEGVTTVDEVIESYLYPPFLMYLLALTVWILLLVYWMKYSSNQTLKRFSWGVAGGSITGLQNFLKDSLTIFKASDAAAAEGTTSSYYTWCLPVMITLAAASAFGGLLFLTACMKKYDATYSAAMFVGSFVVSASIMSAAHYATFAHLETIWDLLLYPAGLLILMSGVWVLVYDQQQKSVSPSDPSSRRNGPLEMEPLVLDANEGESSHLAERDV